MAARWSRGAPASQPRGQVVRAHPAALLRAGTGEEEQADVVGGAGENLLVAKVDDVAEVPPLGEQFAERLAVLGIEEFVGEDEGELPARRQQLQAALHKDDVQVVVALSGTGIVVFEPYRLLGVRLVQGLDADVWRVADYDIESAGQPKHPLRVKETRGGVLVVRVPRRQFAGGSRVPPVVFQHLRDFAAEPGVLVPALGFGAQRAGVEMALAHAAEFGLLGVNLRVAQQLLAGPVHANERVGGDKLRLQVGQRAHAQIRRRGSVFWSTMSEMKNRILAICTAMGWMSTP